MSGASRHIFRSDGDRILDAALEETFAAGVPVSAELRITIGRTRKAVFHQGL
jgi:hypothetical protein